MSCPCSRAVATVRICCVGTLGGPINCFTPPPAWSVAMSNGGLPPRLAAACSSLKVFGRFELTLAGMMITPPTRPARTSSSSWASGNVPFMPLMITCPASLATDTAGRFGNAAFLGGDGV